MTAAHAPKRRNSRNSSLDVWDAIKNRERVNEGQILLSYAEAFRGLGLFDPLAQKLGKGSFGHAYRLGAPEAPTGVLKLTRDVYEAVASFALIGKDFVHVPKTRGVWVLSETFVDEWAGWYAIEREYLYLMSKKDEGLLDVLFQVWGNDSIHNLKIPKSHNRAMRDKWRVHVREVLDDMGSVNSLPRAMELLALVGLGVQELASIGIDWCDINDENVMLDASGTLKISDVGLCELRYSVESVAVPELVPSAIHIPRLSGGLQAAAPLRRPEST